MTTINELPAATAVSPGDVLPAQQIDGITRAASVAQITAAALPLAGGTVSGDLVVSGQLTAAALDSSTVNAIFAAFLAGLPTTLPGTSGVWWLNAGALCVS